ncbi:MAG TPA: hypothetical protein VGJ92_14215 [Methanocella sp.]
MRRLSWTDLIYECMHFLLGFSVGLLTFSSTWIICRHFSPGGPGEIAVFCIVALSLSASVASHVLEDYWFSYF